MFKRPPSDPVAQLQWLIDRAEITNLFYAFAAAVDNKDSEAYADLFTEDGVVELPHGTTRGREAIRVMRGPPPHWGTHHISTNHKIDIDGDQAIARGYLMATHIFDKSLPSKNAQAGGWYDTTLVKTADGWRFSSVRLSIVWTTGEMMPARPPGKPPE